jgi:hypothetical protein
MIEHNITFISYLKKIQALSLAKEDYSMKLDLLSDALSSLASSSNSSASSLAV